MDELDHLSRIGGAPDAGLAQHARELWWTSTRRRDRSFTEQPRQLLDLLPRRRFQEHDPESHLGQGREASPAVDGGRIALVNGDVPGDGRAGRVRTVDEERQVPATRFGVRFAGRWGELPVTG